ncbi:MAG: hypothetical protein HN919_14270 [Verrucomicrobia bacterium]|nr:hypothetical protein [Verrucomicrobiota bacterium]MBT7067463.1 hypothetical protein [Verrucomicrobiota bacterium]MBT7701271.1 hypothetical protein [Verrucomicrobiota bacterium]
MRRRVRSITLATMVVMLVCCGAMAGEQSTAGKKLQIVLMLGQGEMVGRGTLSTMGYMLQEPVVPPREVTLNAHKGMLHQPNGAYLYWQAMNAYGGPAQKKQELKRLIQERADFKAAFKQQVIAELEANEGVFRGKTYSKRRGAYRGFWLFNLCDEECEKEGYTPKIRAILEAPDNAFNVEAAYDQIIADGAARYQRQLELNQLYLKGTTPADFAAYSEAVKARESAPDEMVAEEMRRVVVGLAEKHLHLPVAERTYIVALGTVAGVAEGDSGNLASGKLSVGYGEGVDMVGLEYAAGLALEQAVGAPILIVKCAWDDRRSIADFWRNPLKDGAATPGDPMAEPGWAWTRTEAHIKSVLTDPGRCHPDYDPKVGFEVAGVIWFQGSREPDNPAYAAQLASLLGDIRKTVESPDLPVVCVTVGGMYFKSESDDHPVNQGLRDVAAMPGFAGTIDVMDSYRWRASEVALIQSMARKRRMTPDAAMQAALRSAGEGTFNLLAGHEAGARLAELMNRDNGAE